LIGDDLAHQETVVLEPGGEESALSDLQSHSIQVEPVFTMGVSFRVGGYGLVAPCGPFVTTEMCPMPGGEGPLPFLSARHFSASVSLYVWTLFTKPLMAQLGVSLTQLRSPSPFSSCYKDGSAWDSTCVGQSEVPAGRWLAARPPAEPARTVCCAQLPRDLRRRKRQWPRWRSKNPVISPNALLVSGARSSNWYCACDWPS
jgi:hypothetical protein